MSGLTSSVHSVSDQIAHLQTVRQGRSGYTCGDGPGFCRVVTSLGVKQDAPRITATQLFGALASPTKRTDTGRNLLEGTQTVFLTDPMLSCTKSATVSLADIRARNDFLHTVFTPRNE